MGEGENMTETDKLALLGSGVLVAVGLWAVLVLLFLLQVEV